MFGAMDYILIAIVRHRFHNHEGSQATHDPFTLEDLIICVTGYATLVCRICGSNSDADQDPQGSIQDPP